MDERRVGASWCLWWVWLTPPPPLGKRLGVLITGALGLLLSAQGAGAAGPLCDPQTYYVTSCVECPPSSGVLPPTGCIRADSFYCVTGLPASWGYDTFCHLGNYTSATNISDCKHPGQSAEDCTDSLDNNWDGCINEKCVRGEPPCTCRPTCDKPSCSQPQWATCSLLKSAKEICFNGVDDNCNGVENEGCSPCKDPSRRNDPSCCGSMGGADPIILGSRSVVTNPFADFSATAISTLAISRSWASLDTSFFGGSMGIFGRGWRHGWEGVLTCSGNTCTVEHGSGEGGRFKRAETALSLDGTETWQLYRPLENDASATRRKVLARRPSGEWILFAPDGETLHFATACDACGAPDRYCTAPEQGGLARLVKVVDPRGNAIQVSYARGTGLLLGLTDGLGHTLEARSGAACSDGLARELRYDGTLVASYSYSGVDLTVATDGDGVTLRAYAYDPLGTGLLVSVLDQAGLPNVEFSYDSNGDAIGIADESTTMLVGYGADGTVTVSESYGTTVSAGQRKFDAAGNLISIAAGCSCGGAKTFTYSGADVLCMTDAAGTVTYDGRDALGRVTRHAWYSGYACPPPATLSESFQDERRSYGVVKAIAQGVNLALDLVTAVSRPSAYAAPYTATESQDFDPTPKPYDPVGYSCAEAPLPTGAALCRNIKTGYALLPNGMPASERHATFYSYDGRGRLTKTIGPVNLDRPSASDVVPVEERLYWPDAETLARRGRLAEVRRYAAPTSAPLATTFDYDAFGLYRQWEPDGVFTTWIRDGRGRARFVLRSDGRSTETRFHDGEKPRLRIGPAGEVDRTSYDSRGRVTAGERLSGDPDVPGASVAVLWGEYHQYDGAGNRARSERRDATGAVVWKQDREFDVQHRLVKATHPEVAGAARSWSYDASGFLTGTVDEEGRATTFAPEYLGRVKSVTRGGVDAGGAPISRVVASYEYRYNSGTLEKVTDANGTGTTSRRDDFDRLEFLQNNAFKAGAVTYEWDARGNLLTQKDSQRTLSRTYDGLDRALTTTADNAPGSFPLVSTRLMTLIHLAQVGGALGDSGVSKTALEKWLAEYRRLGESDPRLVAMEPLVGWERWVRATLQDMGNAPPDGTGMRHPASQK